MQSWDEAKKAGKRAFYEDFVKTIRLCPENYCLAFVSESGKVVAAYMDGAVGKPNYDKIQDIINKNPNANLDELSDKIGKIFPRRKYGYCYGIKERS
jgi:hypothetical protein